MRWARHSRRFRRRNTQLGLSRYGRHDLLMWKCELCKIRRGGSLEKKFSPGRLCYRIKNVARARVCVIARMVNSPVICRNLPCSFDGASSAAGFIGTCNECEGGPRAAGADGGGDCGVSGRTTAGAAVTTWHSRPAASTWSIALAAIALACLFFCVTIFCARSA